MLYLVIYAGHTASPRIFGYASVNLLPELMYRSCHSFTSVVILTVSVIGYNLPIMFGTAKYHLPVNVIAERCGTGQTILLYRVSANVVTDHHPTTCITTQHIANTSDANDMNNDNLAIADVLSQNSCHMLIPSLSCSNSLSHHLH